MENNNDVNVQGSYNATPVNDPNKQVMTMGEWLITIIVMVIPCVNLIMMFVWGFGNGNENRKNFCRANLIYTAVTSILGLIAYLTIFAGFLASYR